MADRLVSSFVVPSIVIYGAALQKNFQVFHIALQNYKTFSVFFYAAIACGLLNIVTIICNVAVIDNMVSPYNWPLQNLPPKNTIWYKISCILNVLGLLLQILATAISFYNYFIVLLGQYPNIYVTPIQATIVMLNNFLQSYNFVAASLLFIYNIASKLGVADQKLASQLIMKYALCDYIILAGYKIYSCIGILVLLKNNKVTTNITLVASSATVPASTIYASFVFVHASFNASKQLLNDYSISKSSGKSAGESKTSELK
ncbi:hypothetical protein HDV06_002729 [Boothiomyces sp. JEL0866]|nr:hypothetical protein HDV06_002729 [Boothiomyces sp. JEL0866]